MDFSFYGVFIIAGIFAIQFFFSTRRNVSWGAILPVAYIVLLTWLLVINRIGSSIEYILYLLLGLLFLIAEWSGGRKYLREKVKKELHKMNSLDIN
ncbi:hypothetical protein [Ornithinibacillus halophilus]|uniref:Uncharacterized protein n=1 Tax=Ornithinibacillus halophilus TaxID=930117 RepID=A0A1M5H0L2_9BACI|nr:hypothetical protein [Ornithinibacillus halophilus]SHG09252.1 hypothetical protein SAMN05216225_101539 [Ornithinibacillus halophilus]